MTENDKEVDYSQYIYDRHKVNSVDGEEVDVEIVGQEEDLDYNTSASLPAPEMDMAPPIDSELDKTIRDPKAITKVVAQISKIQPKENVKRQYDTHPKKRSKGRRVAIAVVSVLLCSVLTLLVADLLSNGFISTKVAGIFNGSSEEKVYYAVELASYGDMNSARVLSGEVRSGGAGGYVINDNGYRVIAEVYPTKNDALSVSQKLNLNGYVTNIYTISIKEVDYGVFPMSTRNITKEVMGYADTLYQEFYTLASEIDQGKVDFTGAKTRVLGMYTNMKAMLADYKTNCEGHEENESIVKVVAQLNAAVGVLENLHHESKNLRDMVSDIRYVNTMILNTHRALVNSLNK